MDFGATLIAVCGPRDPDFADPLGARRAGPLSRFCDERRYPRVVLIGEAARIEDCRAMLAERHPELTIEGEPGGEAGWTATVERLARRTASRHLVLPEEWPDLAWRTAQALAEAGLPMTLHLIGLDAADPAAVDVRAWRIDPGLVVREPGAPAGYRAAAPVRILPLSPESEPVAQPARLRRELGLVGEDPAFLRAVRACELVAGHPVPVLLRGETGTGKELFARLAHRLSGRPADAFVAVNCGALPATLVESILFGHRKGAFTGATQDQPGKFVQADGGTLFLDEVGELPLDLQPKLLRVLQDGVVEPVGATQGRRVEVRVIAATHRDLRARVAEGAFREDLFYRLAFGVVELPALRERAGDLPALAAHLLQRINRGYARPRRLSESALRRLQAHPWPGNIRELEGVLVRSALWCERETIEAADLRLDPPPAPSQPVLPEPHEGFSLEAYLSDARERLIRRALELAQDNQSAAGRLLGVSPQAIHKFLKAGER